MMYLSLEKLNKFFRLEAERGFDNRAVVGGLDKILSSWEAQARADNLSDGLIQSVIKAISEYPQLAPESREESLRNLWQHLQGNQGKAELASSFPGKKNLTAESRRKTRMQDPRSKKKSVNTTRPVIEKINGQPERNPDHPAEFKTEEGNLPHPQEKTQETVIVSKNEIHKEESTINKIPGKASRKEFTIAGLNSPLTVINGIGSRHAATLSNLNLNVLSDLLFFFPRRYDDYSQLKSINHIRYGEEITVIATIQSIISRPIRGGSAQMIEAIASDGTGSLRLSWFNQPWQINRIQKGQPVTISGKVEQFLGRPVMNNPECESIDQEQLNTNRIVPVYPLTAQITQHWLRRIMFQTINYWAPRISDYLPESVLLQTDLPNLSEAIQQCHFPTSHEQLSAARERLAFDEIFFLQMGVLRHKYAWQQVAAEKFLVEDAWLQEQLNQLPFQLTAAQIHAVDDLKADLGSGKPMNRLLQGDVGSGKTIIAALGISMVVRQRGQAALMAPTSILALQHFKNMCQYFSREDQPDSSPLKVEEIRLLIGDTPEAEKQEIRAAIELGEVKLVIGTHSLIEDAITFNNLQMIVVDEQHRFGVEQRARLRAKGENPHLLVMTATPIPRSLALTIYGDLDLTVMDELPQGRLAIETHVLHPRIRERAYIVIRSQIQKKHQAFIIYPYVEQGENEEIRAAVEEHARLQKEIFPDFNIGLLHGRMKPEEKDAVMSQFKNGELHILVSTSVVEVGVDIPNATVMLIEGANRFGLAQLHQFRGRVGRGNAKSYCLLIPDHEDEVENARLAVMEETNDGFILAERDLEQRGPGEFLGNRQSGFAEFRIATLSNVRLIEKARVQAQTLFEKDPEFKEPENQSLFQNFQFFWNKYQGDIS